MIVVADSSPVIVLAEIGHLDVLPKLFGQIVVPNQVSAELRDPKRKQIVRDLMAKPPVWMSERAPAAMLRIPFLHEGELAAISLALELKAELLLIDEMQGRRAAALRGIPLTGTIGILELAADRHLLDLESTFAAVKQTSFWISSDLLDERLKRRRKLI